MSAAGSPYQVRRASLLDTWPEIAAAIPPDQRELAEQHLTAPVITATNADLSDAMASFSEAFNFLIVDGAVLKETVFDGRSALEVLSPGDVLAPALTPSQQRLTPSQQVFTRATSTYRSFGTASVAVLEHRFGLVAQRWPTVSAFLHERLAHQTHRASVLLAMLHLPRAEDRIKALFTALAERLGRMTPDGVVIDLKLTHDHIGGLVGSRRPTVSLALRALADEGILHRRDDRTWRMGIK